MKKVAILQSNYIPWKGYFDLIAAVDEFILYDDMQFTRRDWRNRNQIKTPDGLHWLTVPVQVSGKFKQAIRDTKIDGSKWKNTHWQMLARNYSRAPHFEEVAAWLQPLYTDASYTYLSQLNRRLIEAICEYLNIKTMLRESSEFSLMEGKTERLADLCVQTGASEYVSGPAAKDYIDESVFKDHGLKLVWFDYNHYPEYPQRWGPFEHHVSILDLLFNCGKEATHYMRYVKP